MIGLIPNLLVRLVHETAGEAAAADVRRRAGIPEDRSYELNKVYRDDEWQRLFRATCDVLAISSDTAETAYADYFCRDALTRFPAWFQMSRNSREFLIRQPAIHNTFSTGLRNPADRNAVQDKFRVVQDNRNLTTHYVSHNRHCGLYIALARWIVSHYGDSARIEESQCMKRGAAACRIHIAWDNL